jgi:Sap, sulfolipid-1-addressing protein
VHIVGEIIPLALVVTISPINVIPVILLLFTKRTSAWCFLVGFVVGVASVLVAALVVAKLVNLSATDNHSTWPGILKVALGIYLLVAAFRKFRGRPREGALAAMPNWMDGIGRFSATRALGAGAMPAFPLDRRSGLLSSTSGSQYWA